MSETITGVIIGGLIASVGPITQLFYNHRQSRRLEKIAYLKEKRSKLAEKTAEFTKLLAVTIQTEIVTTEFSNLIQYHLPRKVFEMYIDYIDNKDDEKKQHIVFDISHELNKEISELDKKIDQMYEC